MSLGGSRPYNPTDKTNKNKYTLTEYKNTVQAIQNTVHILPTHANSCQNKFILQTQHTHTHRYTHPQIHTPTHTPTDTHTHTQTHTLQTHTHTQTHTLQTHTHTNPHITNPHIHTPTRYKTR